MNISDCQFIRSSAGTQGGGAVGASYEFNMYHELRVYRSTFERSIAAQGGAVLVSGTVATQFVDCCFKYVAELRWPFSSIPFSRLIWDCERCRNNVATSMGGAVLDISAFTRSYYHNCTFQGNSANIGGAVVLSLTSQPTFVSRKRTRAHCTASILIPNHACEGSNTARSPITRPASVVLSVLKPTPQHRFSTQYSSTTSHTPMEGQHHHRTFPTRPS